MYLFIYTIHATGEAQKNSLKQASLTAHWHDKGADWRGLAHTDAQKNFGTQELMEEPNAQWQQQQQARGSLLPPTNYTKRFSIHMMTVPRQYGQRSILAEQGPHAHWCPHGTAECDFGLVKHTMHVV